MGGGGNNQGGGNRGGGANIGGLGSTGNPFGGGNPTEGDNRRIEGNANPNPASQNETPAQREAAYGELMRDLARLRGSIGDDKALNGEYQQLVRQAQQLDPKRLGTNPQLAQVINSQVLTAIDEVELLLRRKIEASDGSVRSANPRNAPPGYANAVAEYYKRLSK